MLVRRAALVAMVLLLQGVNTAAAEIYRWTDPQGRVHFTDKPPDKEKAELLKPKVMTYDGTPVMETLEKVQALAVSQTLKLYGTQACGHCRRARAFLRRKGIAFTDIDIENSASGHAEFKRFGGRGVPLFILANRKMSGFNEASMEAFLSSASR